MSGTVAQKSWSNRTFDLLVSIQRPSIPEHDVFINELTDVAKQIKELAIHKIPQEEQELRRLAEEAYLSLANNIEKVDALVESKLFGLIVSTKEPSLKEKDHNYYRKEIVERQIRGMAMMTGENLDFLINNQKVLDWLCDANETIQTAKERSQMRKSMNKIPLVFYYTSLPKRMEIGKEITSRTVCKNIIKLLKGKDAEDPTAKLLYNRYTNELIQLAPTAVSGQALKDNLIVSLKIRARQLNL